MISGLGLANYRSFGEEIQLFSPLRKVNLIVGRNNSGKSNILRFVAEHLRGALSSLRNNAQFDGFSDLDRPMSNPLGALRLCVPRDLSGSASAQWQAELRRKLAMRSVSMDVVLRLLRSAQFSRGTNSAWFPLEFPRNGKVQIQAAFLDSLALGTVLSDREWQLLWHALTNSSGGDLRGHWIPDVVGRLNPISELNPSVAFVPAIREIVRSDDEKDWGFGGRGLIAQLAKLQNPGYRNQELKKDFEAINAFLRSVTGEASATLEIPSERDVILVHLGGKTLPLASLGTGIHEVVILASAATIVKEHLVCIEEPEIHIHPILQRKLLLYLESATNNQYLIATHSAHLLEHAGAAIFHMTLASGVSLVRRVDDASGRSSVNADLGYRASDLLQANAIVWVEGPSDRIYLRHWIKALGADLVEGTHYSIMFYGGRLLCHLSANDPEVTDFISLRRLNRNIAILIDSDRTSVRSRIGETKKRVSAEFERNPGFAWVTMGREIENYVPEDVLSAAIRSVHGADVILRRQGRFSKNTEFRVKGASKWKKIDKIKVAHAVAERPAGLAELDLGKMLQRLVSFIRSSNEGT